MSRSEQTYKKDFGLQPENYEKAKLALENALDIRKFEIEMYWKRATYFWALIAVAFAGYFSILGSDHLREKEYLAYIVGWVGLLFTWAWFLVNRGSKFWQENWENHVDMLEDIVTGPLYKTVLCRPSPDTEADIYERFITAPMKISVSKINQWVSVFTMCIWLALLYHACTEEVLCVIFNIKHIIVAIITIAFCCLMFKRGRTHEEEYKHVREKRATSII